MFDEDEEEVRLFLREGGGGGGLVVEDDGLEGCSERVLLFESSGGVML